MGKFEDLAKRAEALSIDVKAFAELKAFGEPVAIKAIETAIKMREQALEQVDHVQAFYGEHSDDASVLFDSLATIRVLIDGYNAKHSARLSLNLEAESAEEMIKENKRGPRSVISRDIPKFVKQLKAAGFSMQLRLKASRDSEYSLAILLENGRVKNGGGKEHESLNDWSSLVYQLAVDAGQRSTATCNVYVAVEVLAPDKTWLRLGEAYDRVM
ncbi:hypothetical protein EKD04_014375 [Chloroflexales bacterium ZM16-3]|nr:hypothetical protein [Chloroflexales bacterium ZM16-3]